MGEPRGIRNCNPGNIRRSKDQWEGLREEQKDPAFFQFKTMIDGYRAMAITLLNYQKLHKLNCVEEIIGRWAPKNENHTEKYVHFVASKMDVGKDTYLYLEDPTILVSLCRAIATYENGITPNEYEIRMGVKKALGK